MLRVTNVILSKTCVLYTFQHYVVEVVTMVDDVWRQTRVHAPEDMVVQSAKKVVS